MHYFCTYFDSHYFVRWLALYQSLARHAAPFRLWALCFDDAAEELLRRSAFPEVVPIPLRDFEDSDGGYRQSKNNRSRVEYYFTSTPCLLRHVFHRRPEVDFLSYLDCDLYFYSSIAPLFEEMRGASIGIIPHRFPERLRRFEEYGLFNVGLLSFRRDDEGLACIEHWRERCLGWCHDRLENGLFADQKYLDEWPKLYRNLRIVSNPGANAAPYNIEQYRVEKIGGRVLIDGSPLIFFHFHGYCQLSARLYDPKLDLYGKTASNAVVRYVYIPYIRAMRSAHKQISRFSPAAGFRAGNARIAGTSPLPLSAQVRALIERKAIGWYGGRGWFVNSGFFRRWLACYDRRRAGESGGRPFRSPADKLSLH